MTTSTPKFENTFCSQCGGEFGPGDHGYSHCENHRKAPAPEPKTWAGSLAAYARREAEKAVPVLGMGCTYRVWTDTHACTVIAISKSGKRVTVQEDTATRTDKNGLSECQDYTYERNLNGTTHVFSLRENGIWKLVGQSRGEGGTLTLGTRREYIDPSF